MKLSPVLIVFNLIFLSFSFAETINNDLLENSKKAKLVQSINIGGPISGPLNICNDKIFFYTGDFYFVVWDINNNKSLLKEKVKYSAGYCSSFGENIFYANDRTLKAIDRNLKIKWEFNCNGVISTAPIGNNEFIIVGDVKGNIYCLKTLTGIKTWEYLADGEIVKPSINTSNDVVFSTTTNAGSSLFILKNNNGQLLQKTNIPGNGIRTSALQKDGLYSFGSLAGLIVYDFSKLSINTVFNSVGALYSELIQENNLVYFGSTNSTLYCIDLKVSKIKWTYKAKGPIMTTPVIINDKIIFGSYDRKVYCLDKLNGNEKWNYETKGSIASSPKLFGDYLYVGSNDGNIYVFDIK